MHDVRSQTSRSMSGRYPWHSSPAEETEYPKAAPVRSSPEDVGHLATRLRTIPWAFPDPNDQPLRSHTLAITQGDRHTTALLNLRREPVSSSVICLQCHPEIDGDWSENSIDSGENRGPACEHHQLLSACCRRRPSRRASAALASRSTGSSCDRTASAFKTALASSVPIFSSTWTDLTMRRSSLGKVERGSSKVLSNAPIRASAWRDDGSRRAFRSIGSARLPSLARFLTAFCQTSVSP